MFVLGIKIISVIITLLVIIGVGSLVLLQSPESFLKISLEIEEPDTPDSQPLSISAPIPRPAVTPQPTQVTTIISKTSKQSEILETSVQPEKTSEPTRIEIPEPPQEAKPKETPLLIEEEAREETDLNDQLRIVDREINVLYSDGLIIGPDHYTRLEEQLQSLEGRGAPQETMDELRQKLITLRPEEKQTSTETNEEQISGEEERSESIFSFQSNWGECEEKNVMFTFSPMDPGVIREIEPMGKMHVSHPLPTDHMYISDDQGWNPGRTTYDVVAPADGVMVGVEEVYNRLGEGITDYLITIWHSCSVSTTFIHTVEMPEDLHVQIRDTFYSRSDERSNWGASVFDGRPAIPVKAGQVIGKSLGSFDFSVTDTKVSSGGIIVPEHYGNNSLRMHVVGSYDYFEEPLRSTLLEKNNRTIPPLGGRINYDIDGKLVGAWFLKGTIDFSGSGLKKEGVRYSYGHLGIAYDYIDPEKVQISFGAEDDIGITECGVCQYAFGVKGNAPDPALVSVETGKVLYELVVRKHAPGAVPGTTITVNDETEVLGVFLVEMIDERTIKVEVFPRKTSSDVDAFTDAAQIYKR
ncbi:hypothetical protein MYX07_05680 [Patescibacteria group bacterium AH-259-L07]|nr:hypothetical protein [Patescibacteria group bacterium AH-259-L07]